MAMLNYQTVLILTVVSIFGCPSADVASTLILILNPFLLAGSMSLTIYEKYSFRE